MVMYSGFICTNTSVHHTGGGRRYKTKHFLFTTVLLRSDSLMMTKREACRARDRSVCRRWARMDRARQHKNQQLGRLGNAFEVRKKGSGCEECCTHVQNSCHKCAWPSLTRVHENCQRRISQVCLTHAQFHRCFSPPLHEPLESHSFFAARSRWVLFYLRTCRIVFPPQRGWAQKQIPSTVQVSRVNKQMLKAPASH